MGANTALYLRGDLNVLIGYSHSPDDRDISTSKCIGIGGNSFTLGNANINIGTGNVVNSIGTIALGMGVADESTNSVL